MSLIKIDEDEWKVLSTLEDRDPQLQTGYKWRDYVLVPSPSGRFVAFTLMKSERSVFSYILYIVDLFTGEISLYRRRDGGTFTGSNFLFYWLNDYEMMFFLVRKKNQIHYRFELDHKTRQLLQVIRRKELIPDIHIKSAENGAICFFFRNSEYLLVPGQNKVLLKPYVLNETDEKVRPSIVVDLWNMVADPIENSKINTAILFGYKEKLYYIMGGQSDIHHVFRYAGNFLDRFLCFDLGNRNIDNGRISIKKEEATIFRPQKIGSGTFKTGLWCTASQQGHIVIISEHFFIHSKEKNGLRFWILNLEEETIQERLVTSNMLFKVTPFRNDGLMLWRTPHHMIGRSDSSTALKCSPIPRNDIIPQLKTICATKIILSNIHKNTPVLGRFLFG